MASKAFLFALCFISFSSSILAEFVKVSVKGVTTIAETDNDFICATLDWWPSDKCDYGQCPWGKAGLLNLDLQNIILSKAIKEFNPLRIRVGGSLQDQIIYKVGNSVKKCPQMKKQDDGLFGFSKGCFHMERWDELSDMFNKTSARITFGLNALIGKKPSNDGKGTWVGDWDPRNARDFIRYTASKGYQIDSYELGNELSGSGVSARLEADQYAKDLTLMRQVVEEVYPDANNRPKILGPAGFFDREWFKTFLQNTEPNAVDGVTHHIYNLGPGVDPELIYKVRDPYVLDQIAQTFKEAADVSASFGPWSKPWIGESGGAYNSGGRTVSHTFADGFWYLDQLGMTATFNHHVYCRQALIGGNYGLLNTTSFIPNPDYYSALLWHRLMGTKVLSASHDSSPYLRVYSHCTKNNDGVTVLLINMSNSTSYDVKIVSERRLYPNAMGGRLQAREEYHLSPKDGDIQSDVMLLNGSPLQLTPKLDIPGMSPKLVDPTSAVSVAPNSYVFVTIKDFKAAACA
ncbi:heparanase-like protein 1 [Cucurbita moschata]|uniref:Heparanase-like protein 1 n=1 Tax=Cucurbita moschata TaxID=3662 RepID=A0A6J1H0B5_CUCMO|nr:heparanase-like protein 1 [Cucurbita moschata]